jgi:hypothetical protein
MTARKIEVLETAACALPLLDIHNAHKVIRLNNSGLNLREA